MYAVSLHRVLTSERIYLSAAFIKTFKTFTFSVHNVNICQAVIMSNKLKRKWDPVMASDDTCLYADAGKSPPSTEVTHLSQSSGGRKIRIFIEVKVPI